MKIAIAGKGGVGKTTLSAFISRALRDLGFRVLAVDADPDANLGFMLGFPDAEKIIPIINMKQLVKERMGVRDDNPKMFKLNPNIDDIPNTFSRTHNGITLIVMGSVKAGDAGCACPENTFSKRLMHKIVLRKDEHIVVDFEAGVEHLGRGTASKFDHLLIVVEPTKVSLDSFKKIYPLAKDIGIKKTWVIANRVKGPDDIDFIESQIAKEDTARSIKLLGSVAYSEACASLNKTGDWETLKDTPLFEEIKNLVKILLDNNGGKNA